MKRCFLAALLLVAASARAEGIRLPPLPAHAEVYLDGAKVSPQGDVLPVAAGTHDLQVEAYILADSEPRNLPLPWPWPHQDRVVVARGRVTVAAGQEVTVAPLDLEWGVVTRASTYATPGPSGEPGWPGPVGPPGPTATAAFLFDTHAVVGLLKTSLVNEAEGLRTAINAKQEQMQRAAPAPARPSWHRYYRMPDRFWAVDAYLPPPGPMGAAGNAGPAGPPGDLVRLHDAEGRPLWDRMREELGTIRPTSELATAPAPVAAPRPEPVQQARPFDLYTGRLRALFEMGEAAQDHAAAAGYRRPAFYGCFDVCGPTGPIGPPGPPGPPGEVPPDLPPITLTEVQVRAVLDALAADPDLTRQREELKAGLEKLRTEVEKDRGVVNGSPVP